MPPPPSRPPSRPASRPPSPSTLGATIGSMPLSSFPPRQHLASPLSPECNLGPLLPSTHTSRPPSPSTLGMATDSRPHSGFPTRRHSSHQPSPESKPSPPGSRVHSAAEHLGSHGRSLSVPDSFQLPGPAGRGQGSPNTRPTQPRPGNGGLGPNGQPIITCAVHLQPHAQSFSVPEAFLRPGQLQGSHGSRHATSPNFPIHASTASAWPAGSGDHAQHDLHPRMLGLQVHPASPLPYSPGVRQGTFAAGFSPSVRPPTHGFTSLEAPAPVPGSRSVPACQGSQSLFDALTLPAVGQHPSTCSCSLCTAARAATPLQTAASAGTSRDPVWGSCHRCGCKHPWPQGGACPAPYPHVASMPLAHAAASNRCALFPRSQTYHHLAAVPMPEAAQQTPRPCGSARCIHRMRQQPPHASLRQVTSVGPSNLAEMQSMAQAPLPQMLASPQMSPTLVQAMPQLGQQDMMHPGSAQVLQPHGLISSASFHHWAQASQGPAPRCTTSQLASPSGPSHAGLCTGQPERLQTPANPHGVAGSGHSIGPSQSPTAHAGVSSAHAHEGVPAAKNAQGVSPGNPSPALSTGSLPMSDGQGGPKGNLSPNLPAGPLCHPLPHAEVFGPSSSAGHPQGLHGLPVPHQIGSPGHSMGPRPCITSGAEDLGEATPFDCRNAAAAALFRIRDACLEQQRQLQGPSPRGDASWVDDVFNDTPRASGCVPSLPQGLRAQGQQGSLLSGFQLEDCLSMPDCAHAIIMPEIDTYPSQPPQTVGMAPTPATSGGSGFGMDMAGLPQQPDPASTASGPAAAPEVFPPPGHPQPAGSISSPAYRPEIVVESLAMNSQVSAGMDGLGEGDLTLDPGALDWFWPQ